MSDFYEIDFCDFGSAKSSDAIAIRYGDDRQTSIHVVDGGFQDKGSDLVGHINTWFGYPKVINNVVASHADADHAGGLQSILENYDVTAFWMLRPWLYVDELIDRFKNYSSKDNLRRRLREIYPSIATLEDIAEKRNIPILEPFQGSTIGAFTVLAPTKSRYLDLIVESEKTPEAAAQDSAASQTLASLVAKGLREVVRFIKSVWGSEIFSDQETTRENEMSVVQYASLCNERIILTADAGRAGLLEAAEYAAKSGIVLPASRFQVPHHGSRRNVSSLVLDRLLGQRLPSKMPEGQQKFFSYVSASNEDDKHPRKSVVRAMIHRGGSVSSTKGMHIHIYSRNVPRRPGWSPAKKLDYPEEQEQ